MSGVNIKYKDTVIASLEDSGSSTLKTSGKYCEGDIVVDYEAPESTESGTQVSGTIQITENGEYDVSTYEKANVQIETSSSSPTINQPSNLKYIHRFTLTLADLDGNGFGLVLKKDCSKTSTNWYGIMMVKRDVAPISLPNNITICGGMSNNTGGYGRAWLCVQTLSSSGSIANVNMGHSGNSEYSNLQYLATSTTYTQWEGTYDGYIFEYDSTFTGTPTIVEASNSIIAVHSSYTASTSITYEV